MEEHALFSLPSGSQAPLNVTVSIQDICLTMEVDRTGVVSFSIISKQTYSMTENFLCVSVRYTIQPSNLKTLSF